MKGKYVLVVLICFIIPGLVNADGGFVHHYLEDVYEPNQKAIIFYNESTSSETLVLQVKYTGEVSDFGWLVPTPTVPEFDEIDISVFYELSQLTAQESEYTPKDGTQLGWEGSNTSGVELIKQEQVGFYNISVINATDSSALLAWIQDHGYAISTNISHSVEYYIGKGWCFTAIKVDIPAYINSKIIGFQEIDKRITNLSNAEEYLIQDFLEDIQENKPYEESVAKRLGIPNDAEWHNQPISYYWGYKWYQINYWGLKNYEELRNLMYSPLRDFIWSEIHNSTIPEILKKYEIHSVPAIDKYDLVERVCYRIYIDIMEGKSYSESLASKVDTGALLYIDVETPVNFSYYTSIFYLEGEPYRYQSMGMLYEYWQTAYEGIKYRALYEIEDSIRSIVNLEQTENLLRYGEIQPLVFIFESQEPIYPLKITSINGHSTEVLIYLFTHDKQTTIDYDFVIEYSDLIKPNDVKNYHVLQQFISEPLYLTKLRSVIQSEEMDKDVTFTRYHSSLVKPAPGFPAIFMLIALMIAFWSNLKKVN